MARKSTDPAELDDRGSQPLRQRGWVHRWLLGSWCCRSTGAARPSVEFVQCPEAGSPEQGGGGAERAGPRICDCVQDVSRVEGNADVDKVADTDVYADASTDDTAPGLGGRPVLGRPADSSSSTNEEASSTKQMPDFGGSWICTKVTGDTDTFLKDMGLGPDLRLQAKKANYGEGVQVQNIAQVADSFVVQNILKLPVTMRFHVGVGPQSSVDQEGKPILINPYWDGEVLCVSSERENGQTISHSKRFFDNGHMVLELRSSQGSSVCRIFERRLE